MHVRPPCPPYQIPYIAPSQHPNKQLQRCMPPKKSVFPLRQSHNALVERQTNVNTHQCNIKYTVCGEMGTIPVLIDVLRVALENFQL